MSGPSAEAGKMPGKAFLCWGLVVLFFLLVGKMLTWERGPAVSLPSLALAVSEPTWVRAVVREVL